LSRRVIIGSVACAAFAAVCALYLVSMGTAGTNSVTFSAFEGPSQLKVNEQGLVAAKFIPDTSGGSATHTFITFTFPTDGSVTSPAGTTTDCTTASDGSTVRCNVGTVNPGQLVKRYATFTAGTTLGAVSGISAVVTFDVSGGAKGGGVTNSQSIPLAVTVVDGTSADGTCDANGATIHTSDVSTTVLQQTSLSFGIADPSQTLPCTWGAVGVIPGSVGKTGAPEVSFVSGPAFSLPSNLTLTFSSLPVPLNKFVLRESQSFDPANPSQAVFTQVPPCPTPTTMPADPTVDACLIGYDKGKVIVAHLLYRGTNSDPYFN
jgi:hypothetical protein